MAASDYCEVTLSSKRSRKCNFTANEIEILVTEVNKRAAILFGKPSPMCTPIKKVRAWEEVCVAVNAVSSQARTVLELKNKWKQEKARIKSKHTSILKELKKTGGGPAVVDNITDYEGKVLSAIGSASISGLSDAADIGLPSLPSVSTQDPTIDPIPVSLNKFPIQIITENIPILPPTPAPNLFPYLVDRNSVGTQTDLQHQSTLVQQNNKLLKQGEELNKNVAEIASHLGEITNFLKTIVENINNK